MRPQQWTAARQPPARYADHGGGSGRPAAGRGGPAAIAGAGTSNFHGGRRRRGRRSGSVDPVCKQCGTGRRRHRRRKPAAVTVMVAVTVTVAVVTLWDPRCGGYDGYGCSARRRCCADLRARDGRQQRWTAVQSRATPRDQVTTRLGDDKGVTPMEPRSQSRRRQRFRNFVKRSAPTGTFFGKERIRTKIIPISETRGTLSHA